MTKIGDLGYMDNYDEPEEEWNHLDSMALIEKVIFKQVGGNVLPEVRLILGIMKSAGDENDFDYFASDEFNYHCILLGLDADDILQTIVRKRLVLKKVKTSHSLKTIAAEEDCIRWLHEVEGFSYRVLGEMYNVSHRTIGKLLKGVYSPKIAFKGKQEEIIQDYLYGVPINVLASLYEVSETSIYRALKGVDKRNIRPQ